MASTITTVITEDRAAQTTELAASATSAAAGRSTFSLPLLYGSPGQPTPTERGQGPFESYPYSELLPKVFPKAHNIGEPLEDFVHIDPGMRALSHPDPRKFLKNATKVGDFCPTIGTEVEGVNLAKLALEERDELALEVARRKVMVFRGQHDFFEAGGEFWKEFGSYFGRAYTHNLFVTGRLHVHPTGGHPEDLPEIHMIYRDENTVYYDTENITRGMWHTDMSHERQPPGLTAFFLFAHPESGGDTFFTSGVEALKRLSPGFVAYLKTLRQIQSAVDPIQVTRNGTRTRNIRRPCVTTIHPLVRRHPVTGEESLFLNPEATKGIVGYKKQESDLILNFLYDHIAGGLEGQMRVKWAPKTVVLWDNRVTMHSALFDFAGSPERRHGARITPQAERPIPALDGIQLD
ncbi:TauD-domain-containing protein [Lentinula detonsa]|uniref:TauD-domain-containing protein n=1 Tax=Lentinula detonsa TaxID=2804962 RepID=A0A9W8PCD1_9AGAR|nr:TauD-domain-containing protein [Lentinula detonsa]